jgi:hypothetical protein
MLGKSWKFWKEVDPFLSFGGYVSGAATLLGLPVAAVAAWAFSQLNWFWSTFQFAGVLIVGLITWLLVGVGLNLYRSARGGGEEDRRVTDPLLIGAGLAALVLIGCLVAYGMRAQANAPAASTPTAPLASTKSQVDRIASSLRLEWGGALGPIGMSVKFARTGERLAIYVEYGLIGVPIASIPTIVTPPGSRESRKEVAFIERFARDQEIRLTLGLIKQAPGNQLLLQWGTNPDNAVGLNYGGYTGFITLVTADGREEAYPFMILAAHDKATIINPAVLTDLSR